MISQHPEPRGNGARRATATTAEHFETVIVGGGQAGLAVGYHLQKRGRPFVILDGYERIGDSWRTRCWDSLRLFTPQVTTGCRAGASRRLRGRSPPRIRWPTTSRRMPDGSSFLSEPSHRGRALPEGDGFVVRAGDTRFEADNVVVASGSYRVPTVPDLARELDPRIVQMHSSEYRDPSQLHEGDVLVVGAGNSGADIALEVSRSHRTWLSGRDKGQIPFRIETTRTRLLFPCSGSSPLACSP